MIDSTTILKRHDVIVSSQAVAGSVLRDADALARIGLDAIAGGANALRLAGSDTVRLTRSKTDLPIVGLIKTERKDFEPRITAVSQEISDLKSAGANIVAIDSTDRPRPESLESLYRTAYQLELEIFADIATLHEAKFAMDLGATYIATTMAGYTTNRQITSGPDFDLLEEIASCGAKVILEGRVSSAEHMNKAFDYGAFAVVIGRAVTSPQMILREMLKGLHS